MTAFGLPRRTAIAAAGAGVLLGVAYTLSPLTIWFAIAMWVLVSWTLDSLTARERRWVGALIIASAAARLIVVGGLFALTDHGTVPFGSFFGDEEYFVRRSIWLRNVALAIPIHRADLIYAFDDYSQTSYLYVLSVVQALVGTAPYGLHLFGTALYLSAAAILYRVVRASLGRLQAFVGLLLLLVLPSAFAWSMSALKEPLYLLLSACSFVLAVAVARANTVTRRVLAALGVVVMAFALQTIREGGLALTIAGAAGGIALNVLLHRPRLVALTAVAAALTITIAAARPEVQLRTTRVVQQLAAVNWGHIHTRGNSYKLLDERFYRDRSSLRTMSAREATRYVVRALVSYVMVPAPWQARSRAELAYLPEQLVWWTLVAILPFGIVAALRRDSLVASLLFSYGIAAAALVALTGGNVGTLVRHRGLALPFLVWISASGVCAVIAWATRQRAARPTVRQPIEVLHAWP